MLGCCVDKKYGKGCTEETCMNLPEGMTCGNCFHVGRCTTIFGSNADDTACSFFPRRFHFFYHTEGQKGLTNEQRGVIKNS